MKFGFPYLGPLVKILTCFLIRAIYKKYDFASKNCKMASVLALFEDIFEVLMKCMMHIMAIPILKFQHTKRKLHIDFFYWHNWEVTKSDKIWLSIFKSHYFLKWCPIFDSLPLLQFSKFHNFLLGMSIFG